MRTIHVLRKPCSESTVASNVLRWGTGALNVDGCRVPVGGEKLSCSLADPYHGSDDSQRTWNSTSTRGIARQQHNAGRWPANVLLKEGPVSEALDDQSGITKSAVAIEVKVSPVHGQFINNARTVPGVDQHGGRGGASRYFQVVESHLTKE